MGSGLSEGWEVRKLGEVCEINPKKSEIKGMNVNHLVSFLPMKDLGISQNRIVPIDTRKLSEVMGSYTYFAENDILLAKVTPCFENGKLGIAKKLINGVGFGSSEYIVFRPLKDTIGEYVFYLLSSAKFQNDGKKLMLGACGLKRLSRDYVKNFPILIPPLQEQKKIVAILDEAFLAIDKAKANAELNLQNAKELFESYLQGVFENRGEGWEEKNLGEMANFRNGINFTKNSKGKEIKIVGVKNFQKHFFVPLENLASVTMDGDLNENDILKNNDILTVRSNGNPKLIGRTILAKNITQTMSHSGFTIRIRLNSSNISSIYLCHYLKTQKTRDELVKSGNGVGIKSLNQGSLSSLIITFPPLKTQKQIVKKLNAIQEQTKKLESIYTQKHTDLDELKKSLLQKAFSGELL